MQRTLGHCDTWQNPDDLRFTKGNINLSFPCGQLQCENIYDVIYALEVGKLTPRDIPSLRVISHEGQLWTLDNKLLYICRISPKVKRVSVIHVSGQRFLGKFCGEISRTTMQRMSSAEFFPKVDRCEQSPKGQLTFRADRLRLSAVKKIVEKEKIRGRWSLAPTSSSTRRSVASSPTVTSRISPENTESRSPFSPGSTCIPNSDSRTTSSLLCASSTDSSGASYEDAVETKAECYPAVRSMTGHHDSEDSLKITTVEEDHENEVACKRRTSIFPSSFSEMRPSTCQTSPRFSRLLERFPGAPRASRLVKRTSSDAFIRLEPRPSRTWQSDNRTDRPPSAAFPDDSRQLVCRSFFASCGDDCRDTVTRSVSGKLPEENSPEIFSQALSSIIQIGRNEPDDDFELEAFVLPEFCYASSNFRDSKRDAEEEISPVHNSQRPNNGTPSLSHDRLDRSVSSCSSSTERPMTNKPQHSGFSTKCEPQKRGFDSSNSLVRTFSLLQKSNIGRSLSPLRRASASAGRTMKCHLSAEHEFEVSKQILLKHMKKAFFSVC